MLRYKNLTEEQIDDLWNKWGQNNTFICSNSIVIVDDGEEKLQDHFDVKSTHETQLGKQTPLPESPDKAVIDTVPNKNYGDMFVARFTAPEFTSMCPVTGQPDFARIWIDYIPGERMIESKALKLFLGSFRNHGAFHEECTMLIKDRLIEALGFHGSFTYPSPLWFRIAAYWYPRGGIPIDVFWQSGEAPAGVLIPELPKLDFMGR